MLVLVFLSSCERRTNVEPKERVAKYLPPSEGTPTGPGGGSVWLAGELYTSKVVSEDTGGAFALAEAITPPEGGPPPHVHHREDEAFYVLEGELEFMTEDGISSAPPQEGYDCGYITRFCAGPTAGSRPRDDTGRPASVQCLTAAPTARHSRLYSRILS